MTNFFRRIKLILKRVWRNTTPQSLLGRSMLILITPLVLTLGIGLFVFFDRHWSTTTTNLSSSLAGEIAIIAHAWEHDAAPDYHETLISMAKSKLGLNVKFSAADKLPRMRKFKLVGVNESLERALDEKLRNRYSLKSYKDDDGQWVAITVAVPDGLLTFLVPPKRLFSTTTYVFLLFMVGSGLLLSLVAVIFMRNQIRPVHKLAIVAEQFGKGIDAPRFKPSGAKEVRQAARAFLDMRDRIKRQVRQRTDMLSGVSHDLRTPLTRMKLQLAMLPQNADTDAMHGDIQAMEKMIKAYLDFAKGENIENSLRCNVMDLLNQCIQDTGRHGFPVHSEQDEGEIMMTVRPHALQRVFANILDNARLYAKECWVTVNRLPRSVEIVFDDNGPGIPAKSREDVFKPFHRIDASRNQDIEGTGLGLTISRDITQSHGGTITLETSPYGGLRVIVWLPA